MKAITILLAAVFCLGLALPAAAQDDELDKLKERFKARYATLVKLKDAGKVGENLEAKAEAVKAEYLNEKAEGETTVQAFLEAENKDRARLYVLMAKEAETTVDKVVERAAKRNYAKADKEHYLKMKNGTWVKKKDLRQE